MQFSGWTPSSTEDSLLAALFTIGRTMRRVGAQSTDPHTYWLLHSLRAHGTVRVTDLATALQLDTSTVSRQVSQLVKSGLVCRSQDPDDGRAQVVAVTAAGERLLDDAQADRTRFVADRIADWDRSEVETLDRLLTRFATAATEALAAPDSPASPVTSSTGPAPADPAAAPATPPSAATADSSSGSAGPVRQLEHA